MKNKILNGIAALTLAAGISGCATNNSIIDQSQPSVDQATYQNTPTQRSFSFDDEKVSFSIYDTNGREIGKKTDNNFDGIFDEEESYFYDGEGNRIKEIRKSTGQTKKSTHKRFIETQINEHDEGKKVKETVYLNNLQSPYLIAEKKFDKEDREVGNKISFIAGGPNAGLISSYEFDSNGCKINSRLTNFYDLEISRTETKCDSKGRVNESTYMFRGKEPRKTKLVYDSNNKVTREETDANDDGRTDITIDREYDSFGNITSLDTRNFSNGVLTSQSNTNFLRSDGSLTLEIRLDNNGDNKFEKTDTQDYILN